MKFSENSELAVKYLRQAIPKMMEHKITPNPINYTLWYSYYSQAYPVLNRELDKTIEQYKTCPAEISENLFLDFIGTNSAKERAKTEQYQKTLGKVVNHLSKSIDEASDRSSDHTDSLKDNIETLAQYELDDEVSVLIESLNHNAHAIFEINNQFNQELDEAQKEIKALKQALNKSRMEANTDPLTGLSNRRILESIYNEFKSQNQADSAFSLIILDIDKFKAFNDNYGHTMGDQILKFVGGMLKEKCQSPTHPVRFGGEEFAIVCPDFNLFDAHKFAESLREKLASVPFINRSTGEKIPPVTASFGVATKKIEEDLASIIERADKALYAAKDAGRNRVQVAGA